MLQNPFSDQAVIADKS